VILIFSFLSGVGDLLFYWTLGFYIIFI